MRQRILRSFCVTFALSALIFFFSNTPSLAAGTCETRALWASKGDIDSPGEVDRLIEKMTAANLNVILPNVFCHGTVYFKNDYMEMQPSLPEGFDPLSYVIEKAHAAGIEVHPWFCVTYIGTRGHEGGSMLLRAHPEFGALAPGGEDWSRERPGDGALYANVHHKGYRDFVVGLMADMVRDYEVDGLHYDYIRAGANSYDPESERKFAEKFGRPMSEATYDDWVAWNSPAVDDIVRRATARAKTYRPGTLVSAAVFTNFHHIAQQGQDAAKWAREGWTDLAFTMDYEMNTTMIRLNETAFAARIKKPAHGVGLCLYQRVEDKKATSRPPELVAEQMRAVRKLGLRQLVFFASGYLDEAIIDMLATGPFKLKAIPCHRESAEE